MKALIKASDLKKLILSTYKFSSTDNCKPVHCYIRLEFKKEFNLVTAIAVDGYKMPVEHSICSQVDEDFTAYIKSDIPKFKKDSYAIIEVKEHVCFISINGNISGYQQPDGEFLDWNKVLNDVVDKNPIYRIGFDGNALLAALQSAKSSVGNSFRQPVILEFRSPVEPILLRTNRDDYKMVLPVHLKPEDKPNDL
jgi:DNA polymerase III sliding clamp (beta) subunit (PCNA family)